MAKIHDKFVIELAEVIKGYGNDPDVADPFRLSEFYRFYELPNIAVSRENFEKMRPVEAECKVGRWLEKEVFHEVESSTPIEQWQSAKCSACGKYHTTPYLYYFDDYAYCPHCGADMRGEQDGKNT